MAQVFTSYSRLDTQTVDTIVEKMSQAGINVWLDRSDIKAGGAWSPQIVEAIDACLAFVLMLSPNSAASPEVHQEVYLSHETKRAMFIVKLEPIKVPNAIRYQLAGKQVLDVSRAGLERVVEELIETLNDYLAQFEPVEPPANRQVELVIQGLNLKELTPDKQAQVLDLLSQLTGADRSELKITKLEAGSVHVFVDMPRRAAYELKTAALNRDARLKELGIVSLRLDGDQKYVNTSLGRLTPAATVGPLAALWLKVPALFAPVLGVTAGKALTVFLAVLLLVALGLSVPRALIPILNPSPTPTTAPSHTPLPIATFTPTPSPTQTATATQLSSPTPTQTETATPSPSPTLLPVFSNLQAEVINRTACRYGPGDIYLYRFGLIPPNRIEVSGRVDIWNGKEMQTWLWGLPEFFPNECWVNARDVKLNGELTSLETVYPDKVKLPILGDQRWPYPQNVEARRVGDEVTITWDFFDVPLGEREGPNSPRYILELWLCHEGELRFSPMPAYDFTRVVVTDQAGCAEPSHGRIFLADKHGYLGPVEIKWPPYPPGQ